MMLQVFLLVAASRLFVAYGFHPLQQIPVQVVHRIQTTYINIDNVNFGQQFTSTAMSMSRGNNEEDDRSKGLRKALQAMGEVTGDSEIKVGSTVVAGNSIPSLGIWQFQSYELMNIYDQSINEETGAVEKLPRTSLQAEPVEPPTGYTRYVALYSDKHHKEQNAGQPVVVSPKEVELTSMQTEVVDSVVMALPLFGFWTALAYSFASQYSERTGGTFVDALFGR